MAIRAVLWDIDDTIFDYAGADRDGMRRHLAQEGLPGGYPDVERALLGWAALARTHWLRFAAGECDFESQRRDRIREFTGLPLSDAEADAYYGRHLVHYEAAWSLFPDTVPVLDELAGVYRHAVLSNSVAVVQERKLRALGVRDRFEVLVCAADLGLAKPAPGAFLAACEALALEPREVAYVGNEPDIDARGAVEAGLLGIWLDRQGLGGRPELTTITGLAELRGVLRGDTRFGAVSHIG
ncbi:HAD family hydrolase [Streptomyces sp. NBC_01190]|jgi:putative hydrolase of the HAD superfamily|uniref:HAD family hydrolase n=1 Tax=Streptomyces sp. NBC_01190 TaxID=2903767 RepID=UPI00386350FC|nr:HAD family hydrolase [Streptomyces sp. NBC_01190]